MRQEVYALVDRLAAAFPTPAWSRETVDVYAEHLAGLDPNIARIAIDRLITTLERRPTIAHLQQAARDAWHELSNRERTRVLDQRLAVQDDPSLDWRRDPELAEAMRQRIRQVRGAVWGEGQTGDELEQEVRP